VVSRPRTCSARCRVSQVRGPDRRLDPELGRLPGLCTTTGLPSKRNWPESSSTCRRCTSPAWTYRRVVSDEGSTSPTRLRSRRREARRRDRSSCWRIAVAGSARHSLFFVVVTMRGRQPAAERPDSRSWLLNAVLGAQGRRCRCRPATWRVPVVDRVGHVALVIGTAWRDRRHVLAGLGVLDVAVVVGTWVVRPARSRDGWDGFLRGRCRS